MGNQTHIIRQRASWKNLADFILGFTVIQSHDNTIIEPIPNKEGRNYQSKFRKITCTKSSLGSNLSVSISSVSVIVCNHEKSLTLQHITPEKKTRQLMKHMLTISKSNSSPLIFVHMMTRIGGVESSKYLVKWHLQSPQLQFPLHAGTVLLLQVQISSSQGTNREICVVSTQVACFKDKKHQTHSSKSSSIHNAKQKSIFRWRGLGAKYRVDDACLSHLPLRVLELRWWKKINSDSLISFL